MTMAMIAVLVLVTAGCSRGAKAAAVDVVRLDSIIAAAEPVDSATMAGIIEKYRPETEAMMRVLGVDTVSWRHMLMWRDSKVVETFQPDVDLVFPDIETLRHQLAAITANAAADSLGLPDLTYVTVVWGNPRPIVRMGDIVLIALNHYLGVDYPGYKTFAPYRRTEKSPRRLPYDVAGVLAATQYPFDGGDTATLQQWMLYEGALVEARMRLVPDARLELALGCNEEQLAFMETNYKTMYDEMQMRRLLGESDPDIIDRYLAAAPNTPLMQGMAPGRVGRYIGYRLVREYIDAHPGTTLPYLLSGSFYLRVNPTIYVNAGVEAVLQIWSCARRSVASYVTEPQGQRCCAASKAKVTSMHQGFTDTVRFNVYLTIGLA